MEKSRANEAVTALSRMVNSMSRGDQQEFIELMNREHRTLQQSFTGLCFKWIENCASDDYRTDGRNEASHTVSKEITQLYHEHHESQSGERGTYRYLASEDLPFI